MRLGASIGHAFRHRVRLRPNDVLSQPPPIGAQGKRDKPGNADEVFGFEANIYWALNIHLHPPRLIVFGVARATVPLSFSASCITVTQIQPQRSIVFQYAFYLAEYGDQFGDIGLWRFFEADLPLYAIISEAVNNMAEKLRKFERTSLEVFLASPNNLPARG